MKGKLSIPWGKTMACAALICTGIAGARAQENVYHSGERITILNGFDVYMLGSFESQATVTLPILNLDTIHLQGDLRHNGIASLFGTPTAGTFRFYGAPATPARIYGDQPIHFKHLIIDLNQPMTTGLVLLQKNDVTSSGNVSFEQGGFFLDTNTFTLMHNPASISAGIITENNFSRPYSANGRISVTNYPFSVSAIPNVKGTGFAFTLDDPLGGTPVLHRTFQEQGAGASYGSIERIFSITGHSNAATFKANTISYLNASELAAVPPGQAANLRIFTSQDNGQVWRHKGASATINTVSNGSKLTTFSLPPNHTMVTAAVNPCDILPAVQINQVLTDVIPDDTLLNITQAMSCDPGNVNIALFASGDSTTIFQWRDTVLNATNAFTYQTQVTGTPYYANHLGTYWVIATDIRGCSDSASVNIMAAPPADPSFTIAGSGVCLGTAATFTPNAGSQAGYTYHWDFGDGSDATGYTVNHTYATAATYQVTLTVTTDQNCSASEVHPQVIHPIPTPAFAATSACPGQVVSFNNNSTAGASSILVALVWDFGDGSPVANSTGNGIGVGGDVTHTYATEGVYTVSLTATANGCSSAPLTQNVTVHPMPVPSFTIANACEGQGAVFTNTSTISGGTMTYEWDFNAGAGPLSTTTSPVYAYSNDGTYNVVLEATSVQGCVASLTQPVTVYENPAAAFTATPACVNNAASFADITPLISGSTPYTYAWTFGDGNVGTGSAPNNTYVTAGTFSVTMTVTTASGCVGSATNNVVIFPGPSISFSALDGCAGSPIAFTNTSSNAVAYLWDFPSLSVTTTTQNTTQTFPTDGTFNVILNATSANGCTDQFTGSITVHPLPVVNLGTTIATCGTSYLLDANPGGINNSSSFIWSTGATTPQYNVTFDGTFSATVTSANGCVSSDNVQVTLNSAVTPNLGPNATFCDSTTLDAGYPGSTYLWSTGATTQTITVLSSGTYSVDVTDQNGCIGTGATTVTIVPSSPVNLGSNVVACDGETVTLDAGVYTSYQWSTGATSQTIAVTTDGYYWVDITNAAGCGSSDTVQVTFNNTPVFSLGADVIACDQTTINGLVANSSFLWNDLSTNPTLNVTSSGTYWMEATDLTSACTWSDTIDVTINPLPIVDLGPDTTLCNGSSVQIDAQNAGSSFVWNSGQLTQTITVASQGSYIVTVTDANGCVEEDEIVVVIRPPFTIDLGPDRPYCTGSSVVLDPALVTTGNTYTWTNPNGVVSTLPTYVVADTGMHYLTVVDSYGCDASDSVNITPSNLSLFAVFLADSEIEIGDSLYCVNLSYPKPYDSEWFISGVSVSNDSMPTLTFPPTAGTYPVTLEVTSQFCSSSLTKNITVLPAREIEIQQPEVHLFSAIEEVKLYPNPTDGVVNLYVDLTNESDVQIDVFSITGSRIHTEKRTFEKTTLTYDFREYSTSMYLIRVSVNKESKTLKFILIPGR
jgi:PKD repeat protein